MTPRRIVGYAAIAVLVTTAIATALGIVWLLFKENWRLGVAFYSILIIGLVAIWGLTGPDKEDE